jgi:hypothetical protein
VLGGLRGELVGRVGGTDVVRLVDHDQDRLALVPPPPQVAQHRRGDQGLLLAGRQRAQVDDDAAGALVVHRVQDRAGLAGRPHREAVHAEVADAQGEAALRRSLTVRERLERGSVLALEQSGQDGVFLAIRDRVQPEHTRLRRRIDLGRVDAQPPLPRGTGRKDGDSLGRLPVAFSQRRIGAAPYRSQAHEVRVRIEDD